MNYAGGERRNCLNTTLFRKKGKAIGEKFPPSQTSLSNKNHFKPENLPRVMHGQRDVLILGPCNMGTSIVNETYVVQRGE